MNARMPTPEGVIRNEASTTLVLVSLTIALCLNLLPWQGTALLVRPDFLLIVVIYWCMEEPRRVGATSAFFAGLFMDIAESSLTGQNALVYSLSAYLALNFRLRVLSFSSGLQALHIFLVLFLGQAIFTLQQVIVGTPFPSLIFFLRSALGMVFWPLVSWILELPRRQPLKDEIT
jgi:rod shape-determining protein MreD